MPSRPFLRVAEVGTTAENLPALPHHSMSGRIWPLSLTRSALLRQRTAGFPVAASRSRIQDSASGSLAVGASAAAFSCASVTTSAASTSSIEPMASRTMKRLSGERAWCTPGVSTKTICPRARRPPPRGSSPASATSPFQTPTMRLRVVCGFGVTMASFSPTMALSSVDLPTFGRPRMATVPANRISADALGVGVGSDTRRACIAHRRRRPAAGRGQRRYLPRTRSSFG